MTAKSGCDSDKNYESVDIDKAIALTGYGRFHYAVITASALCIISAGFQNGLSSYVYPAAQCDLGLTHAQVGLLNVAFLVGGTCSCFLWGILADTNGRKKVLIVAVLLDFAVTLIFAVTVRNFLGLAACRFLNGFLVGAPGSITFTYIAEFHTSKSSGKSVCYAGVFFTSAWLLLPVVAFLILPLKIDFEFENLFFANPWRMFMVVLVIPELIAILLLAYLPESPKFYVATGNNELALHVLKRMYATNTGIPSSEYPVKTLINKRAMPIKTNDTKSESFKEIKNILSIIQCLLKQPLRFLTVLTSSIMFTNMFGFLGMGLWLPELFARFEQYQLQHPNASVTLSDLKHFEASISRNRSCVPSFDRTMLESTLALGICTLLGNILSGILAGRLSLKTIPFVTMLLGGASAASIYWLKSSLQNVIVSCIFFANMATGNMVLNGVVIELFPTSVSGIAICLALCAGRLGAICSNAIFGYFIDTLCEVPIFVAAGAVLIGCGLCCVIPQKRIEISQGVHDVTRDSKKEIEISVLDNHKYRYTGTI